MPDKVFIAISGETKDKKLVLLNTSGGAYIENEDGISSKDALDFLFSTLCAARDTHKRRQIVFVSYAFSGEYETIFQDLPRGIKAKLFQTVSYKQDLQQLDAEIQIAEFEADAQTLTDKQNEKIEAEILNFHGYKVIFVSGKFLAIEKQSSSITIYDCFSFFDCPLYEAVKVWLGQDCKPLDRVSLDFAATFTRTSQRDFVKTNNDFECLKIAELIKQFDAGLTQKAQISINRYHGASAVTTQILQAAKASSDFKRYPLESLPHNLADALQRSFVGGRIEQIKIGTSSSGLAYDINSAYAEAATHLPQMRRRPRFTKQYDIENDFSFWHLEFTTPEYLNIGLLPYRDNPNAAVSFPRHVSGWYWQPEVREILRRFPEYAQISGGYVFAQNTPRAGFAENIKQHYAKRLELKAANNPLEKTIKNALAAVYGKFCQRRGNPRFFNLFYAAFITSFVRAKMLQAIEGNEQNVICFLTDSIHTNKPLNVSTGADLGQWKFEQFDAARYLSSGVYELLADGKSIKQKTQGFHKIDYADALEQLTDKNYFNADFAHFVGYALSELSADYKQDYLQQRNNQIIVKPLNSKTRIFDDYKNFDFSSRLLDSRIASNYLFKDSSIGGEKQFSKFDFITDALKARRL